MVVTATVANSAVPGRAMRVLSQMATASDTRWPAVKKRQGLGAQNTLTHPGFEPDWSSLVHVHRLMCPLPAARSAERVGQQIHGAVGFGHVVDDIARLARSRQAGGDAAGV